MKLIRHLSERGPAYAALQPDNTARAIDGDILSAFHVSDRVIDPGRRLAPIVPTCIIGVGLNYAQHAAEGRRPTAPCGS